MKSKILWIIVFLSGAMSATAQETMTLSTINDETKQWSVSNIAHIKYLQGAMVITFVNGDCLSLPISEVKSVTFNGLTAALQSICEGQSYVRYEVYDLKGQLVQSGQADAEGQVTLGENLKGVYIIKVGKTTRKVVVM